MPARTHHGSRFVLGLLHPLRAARLNIEPNGIVGSIHLEIGLYRDVREIILRLPESCADDFRDAYHQERPSFDHHFMTDRVNARKELYGEIVANHRHLRAALVVALGNVAPIARRDYVDVHHVGGDAAYIRVVEGVRAGAHFSINAQLHADPLRQLQILTQRFVVIPGNFFVAPIGLHVFVDIRDDGKARQKKDI